MDVKEYEKAVLKSKERRSADRRLIKLNEEIGEVNQAHIKGSKNLFDVEEECGDVVYRLARYLEKRGSSLEKVMKLSMKKYGGK